MPSRTRQDHQRLAEAARQRFYSQKPPRPKKQKQMTTSRLPAARTPKYRPCMKLNDDWREALIYGDLTVGKIRRGEDVPDDVYLLRMAACESCDHVLKYANDMRCACCNCPTWMSIDLSLLNRKRAWLCSRIGPAFGMFETSD